MRTRNFRTLKSNTFAKIRVGNLLIRSSLIRSDRWNQMSNFDQFAQIAKDKWATVSESLRLLKSKERPWANRSGRSWQMSDREQFAQVAHDKWANCSFFLSESLICSLAYLLFRSFVHLLIFSQKTSDSLRKPMSKLPTLLKRHETLKKEWNSRKGMKL